MDLAALERQARERLTPMIYDYYAGGAETETTVADNVAAWGHFRLRPFVLRDVSDVRTATTVLGTDVDTPVLVAPTAYQRLAHPDGECAMAAGAAAAGTLMVVSTLATCSLEEVADSVPDAPRWFQLYVFQDRDYAAELLRRARSAGYLAIVLTVDAPVLGRRPREDRNRFRLPEGMGMANLPVGLPDADGSGLAALFASHDKRMTVDDLGWVKEQSGLPLVVKGIHRGDDAAACVAAGADAVIVSNHGGRQVDSAVATADVLSEVVAAVGGDAEVYVDGGIRHGTDVVKALALGARAVLVGRPALWGLADSGPGGVTDVISGLTADTHRTLMMCGIDDATAVPADLVTAAVVPR